MSLTNIQKQAISKLQKYKVGALFMEPGTGKTRTVVNLVNTINYVDLILYVCPFTVRKSTEDEVANSGGFNCDVRYVAFETLSMSDKSYLDLLELIENKTTVCVCDESLKIKNKDTKRFKRLMELGKKCSYKLILNGTPISKNILDVWSQMEFLSRNILKMSYNQFKNTFCEYIIENITNGIKSYKKEYIIGYENLNILYRLIDPFVFDAKLELNKSIDFIKIEYSLTKEERLFHNEIKERYLDDENMLLINNNIFLEITQKLQHNYSLSTEKISTLKSILNQYGESNCIVCAKFIQTQNKLRELFPSLKVISWQKDSFGLNMQRYNVMIKFDQHWDYALHEQLYHRIYRMGQKKDCKVFDLVANVGLDNMMYDCVQKKQGLLQMFKQKSIKELNKIL